MTDQQNMSPPVQLSGANFPYRQFILGALAPISFFYVFHRFGRPLTGATLAILWSLGLLVITYWRSRRIEFTNHLLGSFSDPGPHTGLQRIIGDYAVHLHVAHPGKI